MKLYLSGGPNPYRVTVFLKEKGVTAPTEEIDLMAGAQFADAFRALNSLAETPVLTLDDGRTLTESLAICRYLESVFPETPMMGTDPVDAAFVEMGTRRMEHQLFEPIANVARNTFELFRNKYEQSPAFAEIERRRFLERWRWFDAEMADGRPFVCGDRFTVADITGLAALMVAQFSQIVFPEDTPNAAAWAARVRSRPSAAF